MKELLLIGILSAVILALFWSMGTYILSKLTGGKENKGFYISMFLIVLTLCFSLTLMYVVAAASEYVYSLICTVPILLLRILAIVVGLILLIASTLGIIRMTKLTCEWLISKFD